MQEQFRLELPQRVLEVADPRPLLAQLYLGDSGKELSRLRADVPRFNELMSQSIVGDSSKAKKLALGHAIELADYLRGEHFLFTHGSRLEIATFQDLVQEGMARIFPETNEPLKRLWRFPESYAKYGNAAEFLNSPEASEEDNAQRQSILSVDGDLTNTALWESAVYFFCAGKSVITDGRTESRQNYQRDWLPQLCNFFQVQDSDFRDYLGLKLEEIQEDIAKLSGASRLYLISVPKFILEEEVSNFVYRSHAFGVRCTCMGASHENFLQVLKNQQLGQKGVCRGEFRGIAPEYRMLINGLHESWGVRTFEYNSHSAKELATVTQKKG